MHIYTRNGDFGMTTNIKGESVSKDSNLIQVQGGIDEINSHVGHLRSLIKQTGVETNKVKRTSIDLLLKEIQYLLFKIGANITSEFTMPFVTPNHVTTLESNIDLMVESTGKLDHFIYLSGHSTATYCHVLRTTTRRVERDFVKLNRSLMESGHLSEIPIDYQFINRLADYFYQLSRYLNVVYHVEEEAIK